MSKTESPRKNFHLAGAYRRFQCMSPQELAAKGLDTVCHIGKFGIPCVFPFKPDWSGWSSHHHWAAWTFGFSLIYSDAIYPWVLKDKFVARKWPRELRIRCEALMIAGSALARFFDIGKVDPGEMAQIYQTVLSAVRSEVESMLHDRDGVYLNATMLVEDVARTDCLRVVARARPRGQIGRLHEKGGMLAWEAMRSQKWKYVDDYTPSGNEAFRSIMAFPVVLNRSGGDVSIGVVCIDSTEPRHFSGFESDIAVRISPYLATLKLTLVCERVLSARRSRERKKEAGRVT